MTLTPAVAHYWNAYLEDHPEAANYEWNESRGVPLPYPGGLSIVLDSTGQPRGIIETTKVEMIPFAEATAEFAFSEGEDELSLESWRYNHELFFTRELQTFQLVHSNKEQ
jgi:uncharacterized protein YhfF